MALPPALSSIVSWVRAGYPDGVPTHGYLPLFALLGSQLSNTELSAIAAELADTSDPDSAEAIRSAIREVTNTEAKQSDIADVRAHLVAGGWPLAPLSDAAPAVPDASPTHAG